MALSPLEAQLHRIVRPCSRSIPTYSVTFMSLFFESETNLHVWSIRRVSERQIICKQSSNFCSEPANRLIGDLVSTHCHGVPFRERPDDIALQSRADNIGRYNLLECLIIQLLRGLHILIGPPIGPAPVSHIFNTRRSSRVQSITIMIQGIRDLTL